MRRLQAIAMLLAVVEVQAASYHYFYFKEPVTLTPIPGQYAVYATDSAASAELSTAAPGVSVTAVQAWPIPDWSIVSTAVSGDQVASLATTTTQLAAGSSSYVSPVFRGQDGGPLIVTPRILVAFADLTPVAVRESLIHKSCGADCTISLLDERSQLYRVSVTTLHGLEVLAQANELAQQDAVRLAEPDMIFTGQTDYFPSDFGFSNCWGLHNTGQSGGVFDVDMDAPEAWDVTTGDPNLIVVVLDTGVQYPHPDLNQIAGIDTTSDGGDGNPVNSYDNHGTPVAGCVSASIDNASGGTVGVAPTCKVASARTFIGTNASGSWTSSASWTVNSLTWARSIGARVTNNSNGYGFTSSSIALTYESLRNDDGIVHFASAGNNSTNGVSYPASLSSVNAVSAVTRTGDLASFSNYGAQIKYSAPGQDVYTTDRTGSAGWTSGSWTFAWGTSFASPYAAGVAALALSVNPSLTAAQTEAVLSLAALDYGAAGFDIEYGDGFLNASNTVEVADLFRIDLDLDAVLTIADFDTFVDCFLATSGPCLGADFDHSGEVNMIDFAWFQYGYAALGAY